MPAKIFISYRRSQSLAEARGLYERLRSEFGEEAVFIDLGRLSYGEDFNRALRVEVAGCCVMLALISADWSEACDQNGSRRLDDESDFVRMELRGAIQRGDEVMILPVLLNGAELPDAVDLPKDLQPLVLRQALRLRFTTFDADVSSLLAVVRRRLLRDQPFDSSTLGGATLPITNGTGEEVLRHLNLLGSLSTSNADRTGSGSSKPADRNRILAAARPLLAVGSNLCHAHPLPDVLAFREQLVLGVREFYAAASHRTVRQAHTLAARFILCCFIDEVAASLSWGNGEKWEKNFLMMHFHRQTSDGMGVFHVLRALSMQPGPNRDLLELIFVTLALGYKGNYSQAPDGVVVLDTIIQDLAILLSDISSSTAIIDFERVPHLARSRSTN